MDLCHLKNSELKQKFQIFQGRVVLRGDVAKDDSSSTAVFTEQGSPRPQKFRSLLPDSLDAQDKQAPQYQRTPKVKMEDAPTLLKLCKSECPDTWKRLPRHNWPKTWQSVEHWVLLEGNSSDTPRCRTAMGETVRRRFCLTMDGRKHKPGNASVCIRQQRSIAIRVRGRHQNWLGGSTIWNPCGND